ncbi:MAG TPA: DUF1326 domain-containing protein [Candidatus Dormibacteraeota bacterium]|nr:DUF1326 domain-containing protein [Candidatus Dormibacteraeota bacterium]
MAWKLEGTYFENCNCDWVCPCTITSFASPATGDRCQVILNYHVRRGQVDGTDVSGRSVSIVADSPKKMLDGGWRVGLIIDDKATKEQADKLTGVFAGKMRGPMAGIAPLIGELLGIERHPIEYVDDGNRHRVRIGDSIAIEVEDYAAAEGGETTKVTGVAHPSNSTITIAKPIESKIKAFGMEFKNAGASAFSAPFNWTA